MGRLSNKLDFDYSKFFTGKFNGYINSLEGDKLIAFRRLDRGYLSKVSRIVAIGSDFEIFLSRKQNEVSIYFDRVYIGKLIHNNMVDQNNKTIGKLNRNQNDKPYYEIRFNEEKLAYVTKNTERRTKLTNRLFDQYRSAPYNREPFHDNPVSISNMVKLCREPNDYEYQWILALAIYEIVYYRIDFNR